MPTETSTQYVLSVESAAGGSMEMLTAFLLPYHVQSDAEAISIGEAFAALPLVGAVRIDRSTTTEESPVRVFDE